MRRASATMAEPGGTRASTQTGKGVSTLGRIERGPSAEEEQRIERAGAARSEYHRATGLGR